MKVLQMGEILKKDEPQRHHFVEARPCLGLTIHKKYPGLIALFDE